MRAPRHTLPDEVEIDGNPGNRGEFDRRVVVAVVTVTAVGQQIPAHVAVVGVYDPVLGNRRHLVEVELEWTGAQECMIIKPHDPDLMFVATGNGIPGSVDAIRRTRDGGASWDTGR